MSRALDDLLDDDPITLHVASQVVLRGAVKVSTLRAEIRRGNLGALKIGKNLFTTPAYIREMKDRCRVQPSRPDSISARTKESASGLSATATAIDEQAALKATVLALKNGSLNTSGKNTQGGQQPAGSPIPFRSPR